MISGQMNHPDFFFFFTLRPQNHKKKINMFILEVFQVDFHFYVFLCTVDPDKKASCHWPAYIRPQL